MTREHEQKNLIGLNLTGMAGAVLTQQIIKQFGSLSEGLSAPPSALQQRIARIGPSFLHKLKQIRNTNLIEKEIDLANQLNVQILTIHDDLYPPALKAIYDPPIILYVQGDIQSIDQGSVAIVGARKCTTYGLQLAESFGYRLAEQEITVTSGLARGIDTAAHQGALSCSSGRTLAVLGSGLNHIYPRENATLAKAVSQQGALLSEFPLNSPPEREHFPRRNRIVSALSWGTLVVEAAERSGALITADWALEQGKEIFAIPGSIHNTMSAGCHRLIRQGAKLTESIDDILEEMPAHIGSYVNSLRKTVTN